MFVARTTHSKWRTETQSSHPSLHTTKHTLELWIDRSSDTFCCPHIRSDLHTADMRHRQIRHRQCELQALENCEGMSWHPVHSTCHVIIRCSRVKNKKRLHQPTCRLHTNSFGSTFASSAGSYGENLYVWRRVQVNAVGTYWKATQSGFRVERFD